MRTIRQFNIGWIHLLIEFREITDLEGHNILTFTNTSGIKKKICNNQFEKRSYCPI